MSTTTAEKKPGKGKAKTTAPALVETASSNGHGKSVEAVLTKAVAASVIRFPANRYPTTLVGMDAALQDLMKVTEAVDIMRLETQEEDRKLRGQVKHFLEVNAEKGDETEENQIRIKQTNSKMIRLRGIYEERFDAEVAESFERFNEFVVDIQKQAPELLKEIESDLAVAQQAYREALLTNTTFVGVASAYAGVNDLLEDVLQKIEDEKEEQRRKAIVSSIKSGANRL